MSAPPPRTARVAANGIEIACEVHGREGDPALLLVMGLGMSLTAWPDDFVSGLVGCGLQVVAFDNRDVGLSSRTPGGRPLAVARATWRYQLGLPVHADYTLDTMADDTIALMDALGLRQAHLVGVSMGGMIAQQVAARFPQRTLTLTSIMSTTGARNLPPPKPAAAWALLKRPPRGASTEQLVEHYLAIFRVIGSPAYPPDEGHLRRRLRATLQRSPRPPGTTRQLLAVMASGDRSRRLAQVRAPTLVIHGEADPLVPVAAGVDTARRIPHARLMRVPGMGHDLPAALLPQLVAAIGAHVAGVAI